jgi:hypothetical protein
MVTALVFFVAAAAAQTTPSTPDQQGSDPATTSPSGSQSPAETNPPSDTSPTAGQNSGYGNTGGAQEAKAEKKLKGCVQSQGGQYMLETRNGKIVPLTGQDVSAHVGHEVAVHGSWVSGGDMSGMSEGSKSSTGNEGNAFKVTSIDHISDTCGGKRSKGAPSAAQPQ